MGQGVESGMLLVRYTIGVKSLETLGSALFSKRLVTFRQRSGTLVLELPLCSK